MKIKNLPKFDKQQFEGTIEKPISKRTIFLFGAFFSLVLILFTSKIFILQIIEGDNYFTQSENNRLENTIIFSERGLVYDRNGLELIANTLSESEDVHAQRNYIAKDGMSHVLGYVGYPLKDKKGNYYEFETVGKDGIEKIFNDELKGENGVKIVEVNALSDKKSEMMINVPVDGDNVTLSIDAELQSFMYNTIRELSGRVGFQGGAGVIMDVKTGEILAMTSFPEYSSDVMSNSENNDKVAEYIFDDYQ